MTDHWKLKFNPEDYANDAYMEWHLDLNEYVGKMLRAMTEMEDEVAEPLIVNWLRGRGWKVERGD